RARWSSAAAGSSSWLLDDDHGGVVALAAKIAVEHACYDGCMPGLQPRIRLELPLGLDAVGMHDQYALRGPGDGEFLDPPRFMARNAVVREQPARFLARAQIGRASCRESGGAGVVGGAG